MTEVLTLMDNVCGTTKVDPAYDYQAFSQVASADKFEKLRQAFILFDKDKSGRIKTSGKTRLNKQQCATEKSTVVWHRKGSGIGCSVRGVGALVGGV